MITSKALVSDEDSFEGKPAHSGSCYNLTDLYYSTSYYNWGQSYESSWELFTLSHSQMIESIIVKEWQTGQPGEPVLPMRTRGLGQLGYARLLI